MPEDLGDEGLAEGVDTVACHTFTKERQPQTMSKLSYHQPNQTSQQDHAPSYSQPTQDHGQGTAGKSTSKFWTRQAHSESSNGVVIIEKHLQH